MNTSSRTERLGRGFAFHLARRGIALSLLAVLLLVTPGCRDWGQGIEFAPAVPVGGEPPPSLRARPERGPWFVDRAKDYGLDVVTICGHPDKPSILHSLGAGAAIFDYDGDGDLDLFVVGGSDVKQDRVVGAGGPWLFRNDGPGKWTDAISGSGVTWNGWAQGVSVADYDSDGDLDLFVTQHGPDALWQNQGNGTFRNVAAEAGLEPPPKLPSPPSDATRNEEWGVASAWGDYDGDGWLDLYVVNYLNIDAIHPPPLHDHPGNIKVFQGPGMLTGQPDRLWRNRGDGTFEDVTERSGILRPDGRGMAVVAADFDQDAKLDLYVAEDAMPNTFWHNLGNGRFQDVAHEAGVALNVFGSPEGSMAVDVADLDQDGDLDLVYSNFRQEGTRVCLNLGNLTFQDATNQTHIGPLTQQFVGWAVILADFDHDGLTDFFQVNGHFYPNITDSPYHQKPLFLRNQGRLSFGVATSDWGPALEKATSGRGAAVGDLDGDGDLDLVATTIDGPLRVLINEGTPAGRATQIRLVGKHPNREAVGSRLEIRVGDRSWCDTVRRSGGFLAASDPLIQVGLGSANEIDAVVVHWPDGSVSRHEHLPANSRLTIRQGSDKVESTLFTTSGDARARSERRPQ